MSDANLLRMHAQTERQRRFAWAKYYESQRESLETALESLEFQGRLLEALPQEDMPEHIVEELRENMVKLKKEVSCPICLDSISPEELKVSGCGHKYCEECFKELKLRNEKCAICRRKLR
jgi:hypothetical protein